MPSPPRAVCDGIRTSLHILSPGRYHSGHQGCCASYRHLTGHRDYTHNTPFLGVKLLYCNPPNVEEEYFLKESAGCSAWVDTVCLKSVCLQVLPTWFSGHRTSPPLILIHLHHPCTSGSFLLTSGPYYFVCSIMASLRQGYLSFHIIICAEIYTGRLGQLLHF